MSYLNLAKELARMQHFGYEPGLAEKVQAEITKMIEPVCIEDGCDEILTEDEEEEGRCQRHSDENAIDIYLTGKVPE